MPRNQPPASWSARPKPKPHRETPAVKRVMYGLRDELKTFRNGDLFASVKRVRSDYAVSDNVAKAALSALVEDGLIEAVPGQGYFVVKTATADS